MLVNVDIIGGVLCRKIRKIRKIKRIRKKIKS